MADVLWSAEESGFWDTANNWSPSSPATGDDVVIATIAEIETTFGGSARFPLSLNSLLSEESFLLSSGVLSIEGSATFSAPAGQTAYNQGGVNGGTLAGAGDVTILGPAAWSRGTQTGSGTTIFEGPLSLGGEANSWTPTIGTSRTESSRRVEIRGGADWSVGNLLMVDGTQLVNAAGSVFTIATKPNGGTNINRGTDGDTDNSDLAVFRNEGTLRKVRFEDESSLTTNTVIAVSFENSGTLEVNWRDLNFREDALQTAGTMLLNGGNINFGFGKTLRLEGGSLSGTGRISFQGSITSGDIRGNLVNSAGILSPGTGTGSIGRLTIANSNYSETDASRIVIEIGGDNINDRVRFHTAILDGTLELSVLPGYTPEVGDTFVVLNYERGSSLEGLSYSGLTISDLDALDDAVTTDENSVLSFNALSNDTDSLGFSPEARPMDLILTVGRGGRSITEVNGAAASVGAELVLASGALLTLLDADAGTFSYDPNAAFEALGEGESGADGFSYAVTDAFGNTDTASVTIEILGVEDASPVAVVDEDESIVLEQDSGASTGNLLSGTTSPNGPVSIASFSIAGQTGPFILGSAAPISGVGDLTIEANGAYSFTPAPGYSGTVPLVTYVVTDGVGADDTSTLAITVDPATTQPPTGGNDPLIVTQSTDNGDSTVEGSLSWAIAKANQQQGADTILLRNDVSLASASTLNWILPLIESDVVIGSDKNQDGVADEDDERAKISGGGEHAIFFVKSGAITLRNLELSDGLAQGERGGGAGMGGALFVYSGSVSSENIAFTGNSAIGGDGYFLPGGIGLSLSRAWSGRDGAAYSASKTGGNAEAGAPGGFAEAGGFGGDNYRRTTFSTPESKFGGSGGSGGDGGFGSVGGSGGYGGIASKSGGDGGNAGDGGLGAAGGNTGFGGGFYVRGSNTLLFSKLGPNGSYGSSGFGAGFVGNNTSTFGGGVGYGNGRHPYTSYSAERLSRRIRRNRHDFDYDYLRNFGGGAGMGGAIFIRSGSITITNSTFSGNAVEGGQGDRPNPSYTLDDGQAFGSAIFALTQAAYDIHRAAGGSLQGLVSPADGSLVPLPVVSWDDATVFSAGETTFTSGASNDGYIEGATVFVDADGDFILDPNEVATTTDEAGRFFFDLPIGSLDANGNGRLDPEEAQLVSLGGIDTSTNLPARIPMLAPAGSQAITPLTTLQLLLIRSGLSTTEAAGQVLSGLGLDTGVDLGRFDPIAATFAGTPGAAALLAIQIAVQTTVGQITALLEGLSGHPLPTSADPVVAVEVFDVLAERLQEPTSLELTDPTELAALLAATLARFPSLPTEDIRGTITDLASVIAAGNTQLFAALAEPDSIAILQGLFRAQAAGQGFVTEQLAAFAAGQSSVVDLVDATTGSALEDLVENATINDLPDFLFLQDSEGTLGFPGDDLLAADISIEDVVGLPIDSEVQELLRKAADLPDDLDLSTFQPLEAASLGDPLGAEVYAKLVAVQTYLTQTAEIFQSVLPGTSASSRQNTALVQLIVFGTARVEMGLSLDLSDPAQLDSLLDAYLAELLRQDPSIDLEPITTIQDSLVAMMSAGQAAILNSGQGDPAAAIAAITRAQKFTQGPMAEALNSVVKGAVPLDQALQQYTGEPLLAGIAATEPSNLAPLAFDDVFLSDKDVPLVIAAPGVLAGDTDLDGDPLTAFLVNGPSSGGLVFNPDGSFTYTPNPGFVGTDSFTYKANDGADDSGSATVTITVKGSTEEESPTPVFVQGTNGDETFNPTSVVEIFVLGGGADSVQGPIDNFFGDAFQEFGIDDEIVFFNAISRHQFEVAKSNGSAIITIDTDSDGSPDGYFTLYGSFSGGDFMAVVQRQETLFTFESFLPMLAEGQAVDPDLVTGIINQPFLTGTGSHDMAITLSNIAFAGYDNVIGAYEITQTGEIVDSRILFANANVDKSTSTIVSGVEAGHRVGFFLIQDGAEWLTAQGGERKFSFVNSVGNAANINDGANIALALNGIATDQIVFHSFDPSLNPDGIQHVLSGVAPGGQSLNIGFEDLLGGGDRDYQDVVMNVSFIDSLAA